MKFLKAFFLSALAAGAVYYTVLFFVIDAPIPAEYWVAEMITVKKELIKQYAGREKIIVGGGSSTLFGVDAEAASRQLGVPVLNFGLHAGLRLEKILQETASVAEPGDTVILPLEPPYFEPSPQWTGWQVDNVIGWDHAAWKELNWRGKGRFLLSISPAVFTRMCVAKLQEKFWPAAISERLNALNEAAVLARFRDRPAPEKFEYSAYNLDNHGDMQRAEGSKYKGKAWYLSKPDRVSKATATLLQAFVGSMKAKGVRVYFANTPLIASEESLDTLHAGEAHFLGDLAAIGPMIDRREDVLLDRKYFFNTDLHLNTEGRAIRTERLVQAIRKTVLPGAVVHSGPSE
ncbi:MAG: hypothetical protein PHQ12_09380 [Chthoniobacteraceae bacterium]|nr:hypothetical protein [Chthoniobacteraceae bacterium]